jgi:hypothetical protein
MNAGGTCGPIAKTKLNAKLLANVMTGNLNQDIKVKGTRNQLESVLTNQNNYGDA